MDFSVIPTDGLDALIDLTGPTTEISGERTGLSVTRERGDVTDKGRRFTTADYVEVSGWTGGTGSPQTVIIWMRSVLDTEAEVAPILMTQPGGGTDRNGMSMQFGHNSSYRSNVWKDNKMSSLDRTSNYTGENPRIVMSSWTWQAGTSSKPVLARYADDIELSSATTTRSSLQYSTLRIGNTSGVATDITIAGVAVYSRVLSHNEIASIYAETAFHEYSHYKSADFTITGNDTSGARAVLNDSLASEASLKRLSLVLRVKRYGRNSSTFSVDANGQRIGSFTSDAEAYSRGTYVYEGSDLDGINDYLTSNPGENLEIVISSPGNIIIDNVVLSLDPGVAHIDHAVVSASGSGQMNEPSHYGPVDYALTVDSMGATGHAADPVVTPDTNLSTTSAGVSGEFPSPTLNPDLGYVVDFLAESVIFKNSLGNTPRTGTTFQLNSYMGGRTVIEFGDVQSRLNEPQDTVASLSIVLYLRDATSYEQFYRINDDPSQLKSVTMQPGVNRLFLPLDTESITLMGEYTVYENPAVTGTRSFMTVVATADPGAYPSHEAALADAELLDASVDITKGASIAVAPFTALGTAGNVIFPDWEESVNAATATADMEDAWFKTDLRQTVEPAVANGEALDAMTASDNNIIVEAATMSANGYAFDPDEVNQDMGDRFFDEIAKDNPWSWYRLNERVNEGSRVYRHSSAGRITDRGYQDSDVWEMTGQYTRGIVNGPGGRRAVDIDNAHLPIKELGGFKRTNTDRPNFDTSSFEIVFKTTQANGVLAYGNFEQLGHINQYAGAGSVTIELKDGYITGAGITSLTRVNDDEWHHVVIQHSDRGAQEGGLPGVQRFRPGMEIWIDGRLDRTVIYRDTGHVLESWGPRVDRLFSFGNVPLSGTPFQGQVMEFALYQGRLDKDRVLEHYRALNDITPVRAPVVGAAVGASGDHKVESGMRRVLILNFSRTWGYHVSGRHFGFIPIVESTVGRSSENRGVLRMEDQFGKDWIPNVHGRADVTVPDDTSGIGDLMVTYQRVEMVHDTETMKQGWSAVGWDEGERGHNGYGVYFTDTFTGERRFINLQQDIVDLEDYDILYVQGYPNWTLRNQEERQKAEAFLNSLKQAIVDGSKMWISNPLLAADLGLISRHEVVPTSLAYKNTLDGRLYRRGGTAIFEGIYGKETSTINDARSWQLYPWNDKEAPLEIPEGIETNAQMYAHLRNVAPTIVDNIGEIASHRYAEWDAWANNRFRVINEIDGLTDFPSYEVESAAMADRLRATFQNASAYEITAFRYENRAGEDDPWGYTESQGLGLKPGDEFIDYHIFSASRDGMGGINARGRGRGYTTYAVPPGHLKSGRAVTTFGSTVWQDNGKEGVNPYKDYITTAVVVPGDRIDGQLVGGYVFMQFSENAHDEVKLKYVTIDRNPWIEGEDWDWDLDQLDADTPNQIGDGFTDYARSWHYATHRKASQSRGSVEVVTGGQFRLVPVTDGSGGNFGFKAIAMGPVRSENLPLAPLMEWKYGTVQVPHTSWTFRGIRWLMNATPKLVGAVNTLAAASEATGRMLEPATYSEKDNQINVAPANAYGVLLASDNAVGKDAMHFAIAATGTARIVDPGKTIFVEPMTSIGDMGSQNVARIELGEINWLTLSRNRDLIELRVEEIGASTSSLLTIPGEVITTGGN